MRTPNQFIITPQTQKGDVYGTEFTFEADLPPQYTKFAWSFGDQSHVVYNKDVVKHIYNYPGIYTVCLSSWTDYGDLFTEDATIDVDYVHRDSIRFVSFPDGYGIPGLSGSEAFVVQVTSAKIDQPLSIILQSFNSQSVPHYSVPQKWRGITPTWRFVDRQQNVINGSLLLDLEPIYNSENRIVAVKAECPFYYIDDLSTGINPETDCPIMIVATLSTEHFVYPKESLIYPYTSYSNSEVSRAIIAWHINDVIPTNLKITENFLHDVYPIKWANIPIPIMVTLESDTSKIGTYEQNNVNYITTNLSYPRTNELGQLHPLNIRLSSAKTDLIYGVHYKLEEIDKNGPLHFKASDEYGNVASGYVYTTITPLNPLTAVSGDIVVAADTITTNSGATDVEFAFPIGYPLRPHVYVSHPAKGVINRINRATIPRECPNIEKYRAAGLLVEGDTSFIRVPTLTSADLINYTLSGGGGIYSITVNPLNNRVYTADVEFNTITCYFNGTKLLTSIDLEHITGNGSTTPTHISVDRFNNVWVALFDDYKVLKFDANLNFLLSAYPVEDDFLALEGPLYIYDSRVQQEDLDFILTEEPRRLDYACPIAETDKASNLWVCYPNAVDSLLVKYDKDGKRLLRADMPSNTIPVSLSIGGQNGVWAACKNSNNVLHFSSSGTLVAEISGLIRPSYVSHDRKGNLWILHGYNLCSYYETTTAKLSTWRVYTNKVDEKNEITDILVPINSYSEIDLQKGFLQDEIWGGLSSDVFNRIWLIDSETNNVLFFKPSDMQDITVQPIIPGTETGLYERYVWIPNTMFVTNLTAESVPSAQAGGDWTGNRWYQKYASGLNFYPVEGTSTPFKVHDLDYSYKVAKVNETFDTSNYYKSLAFSEILKQNPTLFDDFFVAAVGDGDINKESVGRIVYEKIANFVSNRGDYETAEIESLLSFAAELNIDVKQIGEKFPAAIKRLLNIFSVPKHRLRGIPNIETDIEKNIGEQLTTSSLITANRYYYMIDLRYAKSPVLIYANEINGEKIYPIDLFEAEGLVSPLISNYGVFVYNDQQISTEKPYAENLIDWASNYTTISYNMSSYEDWYGDGGLIETMFNNLLTKQLYL